MLEAMSQIDDFEEYKKLGEPEKLEKSGIWQTAIGLQQVDNLKPSEYLIKTAKQNIDGEISIHEAKDRINTYYKTQQAKSPEDRTEEADKVAVRIAEVLSEKTFSFSPVEYFTIHSRLFKGLLNDNIVGRVRDYNIEKAEPVLNGQTVVYGSASSIADALDYDFNQEKKFKYEGLNNRDKVEHIAKFTSSVWQIHAFGEGNTRATAVFIIKYLRTLGFKVENDLFAEHSLYFRNALVRANYDDLENGVYKTNEYLFKFFRNLIFEENNVLKNQDLQVVIGVNTRKTTPITQKSSKKGSKKSSEKIIAVIKENPNTTLQEMADSVGLSVAGVRKNLDKLRKAGEIRRVGPDKGGHWEVKERG